MDDEEEFYAWLDGELDGEASARVAKLVANDPALSKLASDHRAMTAAMRSAFDPVLSDPGSPPAFRADVVQLTERRAAAVRPTFGWPHWTAIAATLVLGLAVGTMVPRNQGAPVESHNGRLYAASDLGNALERQLASTQESNAPVRIGLTFRDRAGRTCRSFDGAEGHGLACRDADGWQVEGLFPASGDRADYRMANGQDPRIATMIDERINGDPYDAHAEAAAQRGGWR